jgi:hypothetical protein
MKINSDVALRAGLIGAAAAIVFSILIQVIPFLVCFAFWMGPLISLATGALYVYLTPGKEDIAGGATGGAVTGAVAGGVAALASGLYNMLVNSAGAGGLVTSILIGAVVGAVLGAIGGAIYAAIKK